MRKLILIILVFVSVGAFAQVKDSAGAVFVIRDAPVPKSRPLYVIDGRLTKIQPQFNKAEDLLDVYIVNNKDAIKEYGKKAGDGAIIIVTKKWGIEQYKKKFAVFSKEYRSYLSSHKGNDSRLIYVLSSDGSALSGNNIDNQRKLYTISKLDIESITFGKESENATGIKPAIVGINIKAKIKI